MVIVCVNLFVNLLRGDDMRTLAHLPMSLVAGRILLVLFRLCARSPKQLCVCTCCIQLMGLQLEHRHVSIVGQWLVEMAWHGMACMDMACMDIVVRSSYMHLGAWCHAT